MSLDFMGNGVCMLLREYWVDGNPIRFALAATIPFLFCVSLVSSLQVIYKH